MGLNPEEISSIIRRQIKDYDNRVELSDTGKIFNVGDNIASIYGLDDVMAGELLEFPGGVYGMALNLEKETGGAELHGDAPGIKVEDPAKRKGKIDKDKLGYARFDQLFNEYNLKADSKEFNIKYRKRLGEGAYLLEGAEEICRYFYGKVKMATASNGGKDIQLKRMKKVG